MTAAERLPAASHVHDAPPLQVLHPGDRVLVVPHPDMRPDALTDMAEKLRERFPDVEFTFLSAVTVVVQPGAGGGES